MTIFTQIRTQIVEGINDPGKLKAVFIAGGPGSGKDFVMKKVISGEGLREINSDNALEHLMRKKGMDLKMPKEAEAKRNEVRQRAKDITSEKQGLSIIGRLGLIINGTGDDVDKYGRIKKELEDLGYETMMVFVNTTNAESVKRNKERGDRGGRKVPDQIRRQKWLDAQKNLGKFQSLFGPEKFAVLDNSHDVRTASEEQKKDIETEYNRVRRMVQKFARSENQNPKAQEWIKKETEKRGVPEQQGLPPAAFRPMYPHEQQQMAMQQKMMQQQQTQQKKAEQDQKKEEQKKQQDQQVAKKQDDKAKKHAVQNDELEQGRRLGLKYFGFGRWGRKIKGKNTTLYKTDERGKLMPLEKKLNEMFESYLEGTDEIVHAYAKMTPGQPTVVYKKRKKLHKEAANNTIIVDPKRPANTKLQSDGSRGTGPTYSGRSLLPAFPGSMNEIRLSSIRERVLDKETPSVEKIAQKHGMPVSTIKNQLKMGKNIEHEHTSNDKAAKEIAQDHIGEVPNYYSKLKKHVEPKKLKEATLSTSSPVISMPQSRTAAPAQARPSTPAREAPIRIRGQQPRLNPPQLRTTPNVPKLAKPRIAANDTGRIGDKGYSPPKKGLATGAQIANTMDNKFTPRVSVAQRDTQMPKAKPINTMNSPRAIGSVAPRGDLTAKPPAAVPKQDMLPAAKPPATVPKPMPKPLNNPASAVSKKAVPLRKSTSQKATAPTLKKATAPTFKANFKGGLGQKAVYSLDTKRTNK